MSRYDRRYLEPHGNQWRVVVAVPRNLQGKLGAKLKKSLHTDSLVVANRLKWGVVEEFKRKIRLAATFTPEDPLLEEALRMRETVLNGGEGCGGISPEEYISIRVDQLLGAPVDECGDTGEPIFSEDGEARAALYSKIALGIATPLLTLVDTWHEQEVNRKERTKGDDKRSLRYLDEWARGHNVSPTIEAITRKAAGRFVADLPKIAASAQGGQRLTNRTTNKYISSLSAYWKWLKARDHVEENVWTGLSLPKERPQRDELERSFTDDEVRNLLAGKPNMEALGPLMRIAALTGARIDAIVSLRVKDCADGLFRFKAQKREAGERAVPIHSALVDLAEELVRNKGPLEDLFPSIPEPPKGTQQERSMPAVKAFGRYRKTVGVDDTRPGRRRSLVNFHSFRRWFITKAERAGIPEGTIATVVGHKRTGMTFGLYSGGPDLDQLRACIEAVRLPE
ncbi:tyrosine-type recombinase/integrase [Rhodomicrobium sp.]|uniref:tyrosine-type recombinase/integrase n=1 Tax=Rhodomicrobium sp. TaxID=2720632 RepID=UPI0039E3CC20